ncbi:hypothetical protein [Agrobacterium tumefaciens]|uniref:hypothetical protein n=1 Tax=Agrobacterium tumefaciens TaxID=358 RepID=UPI00045AAC11|nr:hypothetical protein [Agrobacterium tumefaciens]CDN96513.1 hypothetical protein BN949_05692 [Agrobacterium tumefaciens]
MNREDIDFFVSEYPHWWNANPVLQDFPDGWTALLAEFFHALTLLNSPTSQQKVWVSVHFERSEVGPWTAYVSPAVRFKDWSSDDALHLIRVVEVINNAMSRTCEICGASDGIPRLQPKPERVLCEEHRHAD